jgi:hypothetical protein
MFIYTGCMYFSERVRERFEAEYPSIIYPVEFSTVCWAFAGLFSSLILAGQTFSYHVSCNPESISLQKFSIMEY